LYFCNIGIIECSVLDPRSGTLRSGILCMILLDLQGKRILQDLGFFKSDTIFASIGETDVPTVVEK
jgi:hypothetical protein